VNHRLRATEAELLYVRLKVVDEGAMMRAIDSILLRKTRYKPCHLLLARRWLPGMMPGKALQII
jgi:hypothetical protein